MRIQIGVANRLVGGGLSRGGFWLFCPTLSEKKSETEPLAATRIIRYKYGCRLRNKFRELYGSRHGTIVPPTSFVDHFVRDVSPIEVRPV